MMEPSEVHRILERLEGQYGGDWWISATYVGWHRRLQWRAERLGDAGPQVVRTRTSDELEAAIDFHCQLDKLRSAYGNRWVIGCQVKEEGVPCWAWAQRKARLAYPADNAFSATTPEKLDDRLVKATLQECTRFVA